jgi:hypothetical protein
MFTSKDLIKYGLWVVFVLTVLAFCVTFFAPDKPKQSLSGERNYAIHSMANAASWIATL